MIPLFTILLFDVVKVNINRNGHWNRLHTHAGASWSGVYYIKSVKESLLRNYRYRFLLGHYIYWVIFLKIVHIHIHAICSTIRHTVVPGICLSMIQDSFHSILLNFKCTLRTFNRSISMITSF